MSDQPPPPKPKVGSLRDRIAAFEKSAASTGPAPAPAPRPKPAGFQSWKPKVPSPPSSPNPSADNAGTSTVKPGGMSASDAKESITKAGSLKDRMAALQGKGAFGAPPVPAAKPRVEKPKWKPPPVVHAPVDEDDDEKPPADVAAAVERTLSPPVKPQDESIEAPAASSTEAETDAATSQPTEEATPEVVDAEEEERQRRAAIAARMARLGGARVGMAPPVFGKKPPVRRPTQESEESKPAAEVSSPPPAAAADAPTSPPVITAEIATSPPPVAESASLSSSEARSPEPAPPVRKNSESVSILSADSADSQASRPPTSMPMAAVPRRTGPPRKKPAKAVPPPPPTEEVAEPAEPVAPQPDVAEAVEKPAVAENEKPSAELASPPAVEEPEAAIAAPEDKEPVVSPALKEEPSDKEDDKVAAEGLVSEALSPPSKQAPIDRDTPSPGVVSVQPSSISSIIETSVPKEEEGVLSPPPSRATPSAIDDELVEEDDGSEYSDEPPVAPTPVPVPATEPTDVPPAKKSSGILVGTQDEEKPIEPAPEKIATKAEDVIDEEPESEEARKKRIAEKMAKMGGFNPFAPPPAHPAADSQTSPKSPPQSPPVALAASVPLPSSPPIPPATVTPSIAEALKQDKVGDEPSEASLDDESDGEDEEDTEDVPGKDGRIEHRGAPLSSQPRLGLERQSVQATSSGATQLPTHSQDQAGEDSDELTEDIPEAGDLSSSQQPSESEPLPSPPPRPAQPPRRIIPQTPEPSQSEEQEACSEDESDEDAGNDDRLAQSHLFIPPPTAQRSSTTTAPRSRYTERDEDGNGSESDTPALPYRQRQSVEISPQRARSPLSEEEVMEPESDHDGQALPIRPRQPSGSLPKALDDDEDDDIQEEEYEDNTKNVPFKEVTPMVAVSSSNTISDDEEGDPIDPSFHSPSRSPSISNLRAESQAQAEISSPPVPPPAALSPPPLPPNRPSPSSPPKRTSISSPPPPPPVRSVQPERSPPLPASIPESATQAADAPEEDAESARRRTIAERMAKLGGIKFGAAPPALPKHRPPPPPQEQEDTVEQSEAHEAEGPPAALSEEEEERARKERIAAKMANMGGMRIGMLPMGMGQMPQQRSHVLREEDVARPPPLPQAPRAVPPSRPPPPTAPPPPVAADTDSEYSTEDGVKVEAEESEADEVTYDDVQEAEEEEAPPPIPSRTGRGVPHRQSTLEQPALTSPTTSSFRPPVPTTIPMRKASVQSTRSGSMSEATVASPPRRVIPAAPSDFVMVDEPESAQEEEEAPPPPPPRPTSRVPPSRSSTIPQPPILSQAATTESTGDWELTSNPMSNLDFGGGADLSLSWTDAGESVSPALPSLPPPRVPAKAPAASSQKQQPPQSLSADELMMVWGRVGVQICEAATTMFEKSKKGVVGDGTYAGFVDAVFAAVPSASQNYGYGYLVYLQNGSAVQKRASDIMPGDVVELADAKFKGHKGLQTYQQHVGGSDEGPLVGIVGEFEAKKTKIRVFQANHHVGQQTVESVSYRLEDLKSGVVKVYRVLEA